MRQNKFFAITISSLLLFLSACGSGSTVTFTITPTDIPSSIPTRVITAIPSPTNTATPVPTPLPVEMVLIPAGEFTMGSNSGKPDAQPVRQVYLDAFYIDKYEVTNAMYKACVEAGICLKPSVTAYYNDPQYEQHPVVHISWASAREYCEWRGARLPTEAEWEKAARGTDERIYPWGNDFDESALNFCDINCSGLSADQNSDDGYPETAPVGSYPNGVSPYGVYDMTGNVWEWIADWWDENYYTTSPDENPTGPTDGELRVLRGGSWSNTSSVLTAVYRHYDDPRTVRPAGNRGIYGVRCVSSP